LHIAKTLFSVHGKSCFTRAAEFNTNRPEGEMMLIALHKNASATPVVRAEIAASSENASALAKCYGITEKTIYKQKSHEVFSERLHTQSIA
jgi:hypothetical protein